MTASSVIWTSESIQRRDHRKRAVAGEAERRQASPARLTSASGRTDLQRVLCPDEPDEKGEERCLLRRDVHLRHRHRRRYPAELGHHRMLGRVALRDVVVEAPVETHRGPARETPPRKMNGLPDSTIGEAIAFG